jgi:L-ectoine synthase
MLVRKLEDITGTDADVDTEGWNSRRLILKKDGMGYSVHDTIIKEGAELKMWYKNHLEAVYLTEGKGEIEDLKTGEIHQLEKDTIYALNDNDQHILRANKGTHMRMVCVFNPPVTGKEVHDEDGAYLIDED